MRYTLGVDIGTYQTKGVLVDDEGRVVAEAARDHQMIVPRPGWAEHRAEEDWWGDFVHVTRAVLAASGVPGDEVAAVACSAIGPCMLPVDGQGAPLMNGVLYGVDTRAMAEVEEMTQAIGADVVLDRCGNALTSQSVGPKILWLKRNRPEVFDAAARILTSTSFVVHRLTGEYVIDHYTAANFSPLYDVGAQDWCFDLAPDLIGADRLPRLLWSSEIAGRITDSAAAETGLAAGTPVTAGTIDAAAEALSVGVRGPGDMMVMYGSTIFIITLTPERVRDARLWYAPWLFPGQHASMAGLATSGTLTHWFRDQFARELPRDEAFATLAAEAAGIAPGADGLLFLPYFSGERTPIHDPHAKGAFFGLNLTHTRAHLYRALLEGIAHGTAHVAETYRGAGAPPTRVLAVGGGTRNAIWMQATSDISGLDQEVCERTTGASYGDAFLARVALGEAEAGDIAAWNPVARKVVAGRRPEYVRAYPLFRRLYEQTKDIARDLST
ncbi:FGGY-family carbohydrate kinase [Roseibacterium sp. SDUM158017]|uniref:FGGY-family carbohydrate kinase n=1 Tax=Roseicyclus salinarum TaxID=3036773 RepID=UPI00241539D1|nr:FGGY-family carbohydrate kinase [Roseibacterium sp. SDUM158017]MDG4649553.1 FGGY-family carbohydrate kinase [Roseibacterium sp. SDUM158017]